ncbi:hypothetical protein PCE1_004282 [Barthelona sp. PCE]
MELELSSLLPGTPVRRKRSATNTKIRTNTPSPKLQATLSFSGKALFEKGVQSALSSFDIDELIKSSTETCEANLQELVPVFNSHRLNLVLETAHRMSTATQLERSELANTINNFGGMSEFSATTWYAKRSAKLTRLERERAELTTYQRKVAGSIRTAKKKQPETVQALKIHSALISELSKQLKDAIEALRAEIETNRFEFASLMRRKRIFDESQSCPFFSDIEQESDIKIDLDDTVAFEKAVIGGKYQQMTLNEMVHAHGSISKNRKRVLFAKDEHSMAWDFIVVAKLIARGGFSTCFDALEFTKASVSPSRRIALKIISLDNDEFCGSSIMNMGRADLQWFVRHMFQEVEVWSQLEHKNVVGFYGVVKFDPSHIGLKSEFCGGGDLHTLIVKKVLNPKRIRAIVYDVVNAISYLHSKHIIHYDVQPKNILLGGTLDLTAKITDFGLSKITKQKTHDGHLKRENTAVGAGVPLFQAPETQMSGEVTSKADIWSLGMVALRCFVDYDACAHIRSQIAAGLSTNELIKCIEEKISPHARSFITACLARNVTARPSVEDLLAHEWFQT